MTIHPAKTGRASGEPQRVAVLGAPGTGKTRLATELQVALGHSPDGESAFVVADDPPLAAVLPAADGEKAGFRRFDRVLLMGLDLPAPNAGESTRHSADQQLRQILAKTDQPYTVVYGTGAARLANALGALNGLLACGNPQAVPTTSTQAHRPWVWACDTCSDPDCERRLLSDLLASRVS
ncbi:hypothetical protein [Polaromonas sp.]|uniref:hypothetical protein n=1 Tax=Polaromonas sp. TaxID=1869339 RepID=UPI00326450B8